MTRQLIAGLLLAGACGPQGTSVTGDLLAITGATLIDGSGSGARPDAVVVAERGRISCVGTAAECPVPPGARRIDGRGRWIIPGLFDAHVHLSEERGHFGSLYLAFGITSVRDMGGYPDSLLALRARIAAGSEPGPRIFLAGRPLDGDPPRWPAGYPDVPRLVPSPDEARVAVREAEAAGSDFIKLYGGLKPDAIVAAVAEAHARGLRTTIDLGPLPLPAIEAAVAAGVDGIEHSIVPLELRKEVTREIYPAAPPGDTMAVAALLERMRAGGTVLSSTLAPPFSLEVRTDAPTYRALPPVLQQRSREMVRNVFFETACRALGMFAARGGTILAGTDSYYLNFYPGDLHRELALQVNCGLTPEQALAAATRNPAAWLGADSVGTIAVGKVADLVVLRADPLADIRNTEAIELVIQGGRVWRPEELIATARDRN